MLEVQFHSDRTYLQENTMARAVRFHETGEPERLGYEAAVTVVALLCDALP
jgi:hypothetical protein